MDISKLTIQGFKSFYEKAIFTFDKNITSIVGPNGSGKSNITEAIRFVLGEQSSKAMRGKDITDMLFRGNAAKANKAKVEIIFVKSKKSSLKASPEQMDNIFVKNALEKDEVSISRSIFQDGKSIYEMNGVEVRLKDVQEFLLYVNLGNKSSWHISQGEADRVLQSNPVDRKGLIEDALGLKVYHSRIKESERKLDKTRENIKEATFRRKEILPELSMLKKQVERIEQGAQFRSDLTEKASVFIDYKKKKIEKHKLFLQTGKSIVEMQESLKQIEDKIGKMELSLHRSNETDISVLEGEMQKDERIFLVVSGDHSRLTNAKRDLENKISYQINEKDRTLEELANIDKELTSISVVGNDLIFAESDVKKVGDYLENVQTNILASETLDQAKTVAREIDYNFKKLLTKGSVVTKDNVKQISYLQSIKNRLLEKELQVVKSLEHNQFELGKILPEINSSELKLKIVTERVENFKKQILEFRFQKAEEERDLQKLNFDRNQLQTQISQTQIYLNNLNEMTMEIETDVSEFKLILGNNFLHENVKVCESEEEFMQLKRNIERLKIRLEESQVVNPDEVMSKFKDMSDRDQFLIKEISDLENSMQNLITLISDLKNSLKFEFETGLVHINTIFDSYVKRLFGGGSANVYAMEVESRRKNVGVDGEQEEEEEEEARIGVEVEVEIPKKKVKGLHSLSGGERALVSIALNFSIINQNPAPFMILDETDAALDEANSKRYGEILEMLKQQTKLVVVTHNRETMHFADQIYGVTLHKDGHSKVLSVSFDEASEYAK